MDWLALSKPWLKNETPMEQAFSAVLDGLMARAALAPGQRVLDVGCGMGKSILVAAEAVGPNGRVTGIDIAPPMVERANARAPAQASVIVADAGTYPFETGSYDAIISQFGTMFFEDTAAAFANLRGAVRTGAPMTLAAWGPPPRNPWFSIPLAAIERVLGPQERPDPTAPGPFRFADAAPVVELLTAAGWDATVETADLYLLPTGTPSDLAAILMEVGAGARVLADLDVSAEDSVAIEAEIARSFAPLVRDGAVRVPAAIHYFRAVARG